MNSAAPRHSLLGKASVGKALVGEAVVAATRHLQQGETENAVALLEKVVHEEPRVPVFRYLLGVAQSRQNLVEPAIANFEMAVRGEEQNVDYLVALCGALFAERPLDAIDHLSRAVHLGSQHAQAYSRLADLLIDAQKADDALRICDSGLTICGEDAAILSSRGRALGTLARCEEGLECLRKAEALRPRDLLTTHGLGSVLLALGRVAEARSYFERAGQLGPNSAEAHFSLALVLLLQGNYREGFLAYERRWGTRLFRRQKAFAQPVWDGMELQGRRILLHAEQGAGDTIQFVRYAEFVKARGGRVILLAPAPLSRLLSWLDCEAEIAASDSALPDFDVHCPLLSLPRLARTDEDSIPPPAHFAVPSPMKQKWNETLGEKRGMRVGIVWAGTPSHLNDRNRSFACRLFAPLLEIPQAQWFSLQVGPAAAQLAEPGIQGKVRDLSPELTDYAETAAAVTQLDLVITADTSVAHLAGSLGTPVWMLTPFAPDWRWLLEREDSPWYPAMRLFRQATRGDWEGVVRAVAVALRLAPKNEAKPEPAGDERARLAADFLPAGATVLDLGHAALEDYLPPGCRYVPCGTLCDFNEQPVPRPPGVTHVAALGVLEYIHDWRGFLRQLRAFGLPVVLSYCPAEFTSHPDRKALGWVNHLGLEELRAGIAEAGFHPQSSLRADGNQMLLRIVAAETRLPVRRRVLVMSDTGASFGDRLGFHTINSLMPAGAEVHHGHLRPWHVPPGDFDLLVLGVGNSVSRPILTDQLMDLVTRIPRSIGIFGTQYREGIDGRRMAQLIDRLTVWFARYEEDLLLYGGGRKKAVHLGDWLISAFPLTRWERDETLQAGPDVLTDMPLDRAIRNIRTYRSVVAEGVNPLLCALTSAERVAYREQRDDGSGKVSGEFRSLLIDIFGRTWPEEHFFEVPRDAVAAYRARSMRVMSGMPRLFSQLLELEGPAR
jgi:tetratricopeptide (TPR) repeat protein